MIDLDSARATTNPPPQSSPQSTRQRRRSLAVFVLYRVRVRSSYGRGADTVHGPDDDEDLRRSDALPSSATPSGACVRSPRPEPDAWGSRPPAGPTTIGES